MTEEQNKLAELAVLSEKATPGPWKPENAHRIHNTRTTVCCLHFGEPLGPRPEIDGYSDCLSLASERGVQDAEFLAALVNWFRANHASLRAEREPVRALALLERAYWIATGLNPAQDLGPDAMSAPLTDEEIIKQAELTASIVQEREPATDAVLEEYDQKSVDIINNLAMLVRRLCYKHPNDKLTDQAMAYLRGEKLEGSILRAALKGKGASQPSGDYVMVPREPTVEVLRRLCTMMFTAEWADEGQTFQERCLAEAKDLYHAITAAEASKGDK